MTIPETWRPSRNDIRAILSSNVLQMLKTKAVSKPTHNSNQSRSAKARYAQNRLFFTSTRKTCLIRSSIHFRTIF